MASPTIAAHPAYTSAERRRARTWRLLERWSARSRIVSIEPVFPPPAPPWLARARALLTARRPGHRRRARRRARKVDRDDGDDGEGPPGLLRAAGADTPPPRRERESASGDGGAGCRDEALRADLARHTVALARRLAEMEERLARLEYGGRP